MARWQPDARGRLGQAAMDLYLERGYEQVTVAEIAERAGLTARTFFRYFTDKREVLFDGAASVPDLLRTALAAAPPDLAPLDAIARALDELARTMGDDHEFAHRRHTVIAANPELQERELIKLASWTDVLAAGLKDRGVADNAAAVAAEGGLAAFRVAFRRWVDGAGTHPLADVLADTFADLRGVVESA